MGIAASVTETVGEPPASLINPAGRAANMQNGDSFLAPKFNDYTPKTLYKVKSPLYITPSSISLKPLPSDSNLYFISFSGKCEEKCSIRVYIYAKENCNDKEYTESIEMLSYGRKSNRSIPHAVSLEVGEFTFDGCKEDTGIVDIRDIGVPEVDYTKSWPVIIGNSMFISLLVVEMAVCQPRPNTVSRLYSFCAMSIVQESPRIKLITQKAILQDRGFYLHEMYGLEDLTSGSEEGKECMVCMTNPRDTCVMPCRHVCCCADCANTLRLQSDKCPVCREPMTDLVYLSVNPQYNN